MKTEDKKNCCKFSMEKKYAPKKMYMHRRTTKLQIIERLSKVFSSRKAFIHAISSQNMKQ